MLVTASLISTVRISTYLKIFYEAEQKKDISWQTRIQKLRKNKSRLRTDQNSLTLIFLALGLTCIFLSLCAFCIWRTSFSEVEYLYLYFVSPFSIWNISFTRVECLYVGLVIFLILLLITLLINLDKNGLLTFLTKLPSFGKKLKRRNEEIPNEEKRI